MNPFRKRSKSASATDNKRRGGASQKLSGSPQIISSLDVAFSLPSEKDFRTSLLMPKMVDRFSLLRVDENGNPTEQHHGPHVEEVVKSHFNGGHTRDLSVLEEGDEDDEVLPIQPWDRRQTQRGHEKPVLRNGISKDEFIRVRAQEGGSSMFSSKQRTFKIRSPEEQEIDRQYSSSSISTKSPQSPGFECRPASSHTSTTSSILFSTPKPPPITTKLPSNALGFDFGLAEAPKSLQQPPSPTSTVYEVIDSPTVPDFLLAEDESTTVDLVRNHLRRPSTSHTNAALNLSDSHPSDNGGFKNSWNNLDIPYGHDKELGGRESDLWDEESGVFAYYEQRSSNGDGSDSQQQTANIPSKVADSTNAYSVDPYTTTTVNVAPASPKNRRGSFLTDLPPSKTPLNVVTNVTVLKSPATFTSPTTRAGIRYSDDSIQTSPVQRMPSGDYPYVSHVSSTDPSEDKVTLHRRNTSRIVDEVMKTNSRKNSTTQRPQQELSFSETGFTRSRSNSHVQNTTSSAVTADRNFITPEMRSAAVFPNTPPPSVSPNYAVATTNLSPLGAPDQSLTPPNDIERKPPTETVIRALKDRIISEPQFISMTASVPTVPIIRMPEDRLEQIRNERRKTTRTNNKSSSVRRPRKPMLDDEVEQGAQPSSPSAFTRGNGSPPGVATRQPSPPRQPGRGNSPRRRETTAGSVLFDEELRDRGPFLAGPEYAAQATSGGKMPDFSSQHSTKDSSRPRHRRKVSRQDIDPAATLSSPAIMNQWDGHPKRRMNGAIDPAW